MYCLVEARAFLPCSGGARSLCMSANKCGTTISKAARWSGSQHCGDCAPRTCWRWVRDGVASSRKGSGCYRRNFFGEIDFKILPSDAVSASWCAKWYCGTRITGAALKATCLSGTAEAKGLQQGHSPPSPPLISLWRRRHCCHGYASVWLEHPG